MRPSPLPRHPPPAAAEVALAVARARLMLGAVFLVAPRALLRRGLRGREPADVTVAAVRMVAGRDLALAIGAEIVARRRPAGLREWVQAGAAADGVDAVSLWRATSLPPSVRLAGVAFAATAAIVGALTARRLSA